MVSINLKNFVRLQQGAEGVKNRNRQSHAWAPLTEENYDRHLFMKKITGRKILKFFVLVLGF
jgi:hypothetical protein